MKVILDGEVCAWDKTNMCYLPFGNNANVRNKERDAWLAAKSGNNNNSGNGGECCCDVLLLLVVCVCLLACFKGRQVQNKGCNVVLC